MSIILITGAAKRIGQAIALAMSKNHKIIIHYNQSHKEALQTAQQINANGGIAEIVQQDLCEENAGEQLFLKAIKIFGDIDIIINSASIFLPDTLDTLCTKLWQKHLAIHVNTPLLLTHCLYKHYQYGNPSLCKHIIHIIDQRIDRPTPEFFSYTASKMQLAALTKQCAVACAPIIRVNAIAPGSTLPSMRQTDEDFNKQAALNPLKIAVQLDEITRAMNFIIESPSMTGQIITLDAGQHLDWRTQSFLECTE